VGNIPKSKGNVEIMEEFSKVTGNTTWHNPQSFSLYPPIRNLQKLFFVFFNPPLTFYFTLEIITSSKTKKQTTHVYSLLGQHVRLLFLCHNLLSLAPAYGNSIGLLPAVRFLSFPHFYCYWIYEMIESVLSIYPSIHHLFQLPLSIINIFWKGKIELSAQCRVHTKVEKAGKSPDAAIRWWIDVEELP
jgi:hypothetical protein